MVVAVATDESEWYALRLIGEQLYPGKDSAEATDAYIERLASPVGSPERAALVADLAAALPGVLTALGVEA